jgi:transcriptional regulator with XRE-family HTH domain
MSSLGNKEVMAKNLRYYIDRSGKTQKDVAEAIGVPPSTFNAWLKAKKYPRIDKIEMLANYFGIKKSDLIEEKTIASDPVGMAERHFEIIMDEDIIDIFDDFRKLDTKQKAIVKDLIHTMASSKCEV